jgi:ATP-dependent Clp protease, protease subunit
VFYTKQSITTNKHNFYLDDAIEYPEVYRELIDVLLTASSSDEVHLYLATPGGRVDVGITIVNAIRNSQAKVVGHLMSICHSMGTFIFLECDEWVVNEDVHLLFHAYSGWSFGKGSDSVTSAKANHRWLDTFFRKVYYPFFSEDEINSLMPTEDGGGATDMYLDADDVINRLKDVVVHREMLEEQAEKEQIQGFKKALEEVSNDEEIGSENGTEIHTSTS